MSGFALSKVMSGASAAYAVYALAKPEHLGRSMEARSADGLDVTARVFGVRDLATSAIALASTKPDAVAGAMASRIAFDIGDCLILRGQAGSDSARSKVTAVTLGWAALNAAALTADLVRRRGR